MFCAMFTAACPRLLFDRGQDSGQLGALPMFVASSPGPRVGDALFFFNDPAPPELYPLSLHDALPISPTGNAWFRATVRVALAARAQTQCRGRQYPGRSTVVRQESPPVRRPPSSPACAARRQPPRALDRKSTRLNSSHHIIPYPPFSLK